MSKPDILTRLQGWETSAGDTVAAELAFRDIKDAAARIAALEKANERLSTAADRVRSTTLTRIATLETALREITQLRGYGEHGTLDQAERIALAALDKDYGADPIAPLPPVRPLDKEKGDD